MATLPNAREAPCLPGASCFVYCVDDMYIRVKVTPAAKRESLETIGEDSLAIAVREPAQRNLANNRVLELIAREYRIDASSVRIISGHRSRNKLIEINK